MPTRLNLGDDVQFVKSPASTSGLPPRRRSLLIRRTSSRATKRAKTVASVSSGLSKCCGPRLPMEVLEVVIKIYADEILRTLRLGRETLQKAFTLHVKSLVAVSRDLRFLILKHLCETVRFVTAVEARSFFEYLKKVTASFADRCWIGGLNWVRSLSAPAFLVPGAVDIILTFTNLRNLHIDATHSTLFSQQSTLSKLFEPLKSGNSPISRIVSFAITNLPRIDHQILELITNGLPDIEDLHLSTLEGLEVDCCGPCYEESLSRVNHSPLHDAYPDCENLAICFGKALSVLKKLKRLHLGIFLSRYEVIDNHTTHNPSSQSFASTFDSIADCTDCEMYEKETKRRELNVSLHIARCVDSLEIISWATGFVMASTTAEKVSEDAFIEAPYDSSGFPSWAPIDEQGKDCVEKGREQPILQRIPTTNVPWRADVSLVVAFAVDRNPKRIRLTRML